jgi:two-component system, response regulator
VNPYRGIFSVEKAPADSNDVSTATNSMSRLILIVDDREDDRYLLERHLRKVGVANQIQQLPDGDKAIQFISKRPLAKVPMVLFLDLKMPRVDGFAVLKWLQEKGSKIVVIICSELSEIADIKKAYALGARSYLTKPLQEEELLNLIDHYPDLWELKKSAGLHSVNKLGRA